MRNNTLLFLFISVFLFTSTSTSAQVFGKKSKAAVQKPADAKPKTKKPKSIKEFLKKDVVSDEGMFDVHFQEGKYYFEIGQDMLGKDMLLVSRIAKIPSNLSPFLNAGSKVGEQLVTWEKKNDKILLRTKSYQNIAEDSDPIHISVADNNFQPIIYAFKIEAYNADSTHYLINASPAFSKDVKAFTGLNSRVRQQFKVKNMDKERSMIDTVKSFPINIEVKHITTFNASNPPAQRRTESISMMVNQSFILLPEEKMQKRNADERVGWFTFGQIDYSSDELKSDSKRYIRKWNLIPKDIEAYKRGELVEPTKQIVYYLDPATPEKWKKYFIQGIEDWNECFETAGFKNAIKALPAPTPEEDPDFSPEDARYSVVRYVASTTRNAVGPSVSDPRTGEIIESDIIWYHNHLRSYRNRFMLETGAANPAARGIDTPEEEIGEMMRRVISHEIGHALGLPHNMKASAAYPVDSLRNGAFTQKYGIATTIMDYARYNYVAQPGDKDIRYVRQLGPYDHYSINYGYRYIPDANTEEEEPILNEWIKEKEGDKMYMFGGGFPRFDPTSITENIGDDNVKASTYGMSNLKIVGGNLIEWTTESGDNYDDLEELYGEYLSVWNRYAGHVVPVVGGVFQTLKTSDQEGPVYEAVPYAKQQEAMRFLKGNVFTEQDWLAPEGIQELIDYESPISRITRLQTRHLYGLLDESRLNRLTDNNGYTVASLIAELTTHFFDRSGLTTNETDRILQRAYVERLATYLEPNRDSNANRTDLMAVSRHNLKMIKQKASAKGNGQSMEAIHYADLAARIDEVFNQD